MSIGLFLVLPPREHRLVFVCRVFRSAMHQKLGVGASVAPILFLFFDWRAIARETLTSPQTFLRRVIYFVSPIFLVLGGVGVVFGKIVLQCFFSRHPVMCFHPFLVYTLFAWSSPCHSAMASFFVCSLLCVYGTKNVTPLCRCIIARAREIALHFPFHV